MKLINQALAIALSGIMLFAVSCKKEHDSEKLIVEAGPSQTIIQPASSTTLTGTVTSGATASMSYLWTSISGPNAAVIASNTLQTTGVSSLVAGIYVFQFQATNDAGITAVDTVSVTVAPATLQTLTFQPGAADGIDVKVLMKDNCTPGSGTYGDVEDINSGNANELLSIAWTFNAGGCGFGMDRAYIKFAALDNIPAGSTIVSAKLSLYGFPSTAPNIANSYYPGTPYTSPNPVWLKRVTSIWEEMTVTWNTQPTVTDVNQVEIPASTSQYDYDVIDLDITNLVRDIKASNNYGFAFRLQTDAIYRALNFASSDYADAAKHPKLVVSYY